jgi:hypothetical protein
MADCPQVAPGPLDEFRAGAAAAPKPRRRKAPAPPADPDAPKPERKKPGRKRKPVQPAKRIDVETPITVTFD